MSADERCTVTFKTERREMECGRPVVVEVTYQCVTPGCTRYCEPTRRRMCERCARYLLGKGVKDEYCGQMMQVSEPVRVRV